MLKQPTYKELKQQAEQGDAQAQYELGLMYAKGDSVTQDYKKALALWQQASEQGHATAQYNLGVMYYNGDGVEQDYTEAVYWIEKAAKQGHAQANSI